MMFLMPSYFPFVLALANRKRHVWSYHAYSSGFEHAPSVGIFFFIRRKYRLMAVSLPPSHITYSPCFRLDFSARRYGVRLSFISWSAYTCRLNWEPPLGGSRKVARTLTLPRLPYQRRTSLEYVWSRFAGHVTWNGQHRLLVFLSKTKSVWCLFLGAR